MIDNKICTNSRETHNDEKDYSVYACVQRYTYLYIYVCKASRRRRVITSAASQSRTDLSNEDVASCVEFGLNRTSVIIRLCSSGVLSVCRVSMFQRTTYKKGQQRDKQTYTLESLNTWPNTGEIHNNGYLFVAYFFLTDLLTSSI